jgi:predicted nucleotidyltransferase
MKKMKRTVRREEEKWKRSRKKMKAKKQRMKENLSPRASCSFVFDSENGGDVFPRNISLSPN